jgi:transposase
MLFIINKKKLDKKNFLQDGAPCLNLIENCWAHVKNLVAKKFTKRIYLTSTQQF